MKFVMALGREGKAAKKTSDIWRTKDKNLQYAISPHIKACFMRKATGVMTVLEERRSPQCSLHTLINLNNKHFYRVRCSKHT